MKSVLLSCLALVALTGCNPPPVPRDSPPEPQAQTADPVVAVRSGDTQAIDITPSATPVALSDTDGKGPSSTVVATADESRALAAKQGELFITVHKSQTCGCCVAWIEHLQQNNFKVSVVNDEDMTSYKDKLGVPGHLRSCHTGEINGVFVEGHVPADDIRKLVAKKDKSIKGIAVPGMPMGSPGMEAGGQVQPYDVIAVSGKGSEKVFSQHGK